MTHDELGAMLRAVTEIRPVTLKDHADIEHGIDAAIARADELRELREAIRDAKLRLSSARIQFDTARTAIPRIEAEIAALSAQADGLSRG